MASSARLKKLIFSNEGINENIEEIEHTVYAKVDNFDFLENFKAPIKQEQWGLKGEVNGVVFQVRSRKELSTEGVLYTIATKIDIPGIDGVWELEKDVDIEHFIQIKELSEKGMIKDRYCVPINGTDMIWEIDIFYDTNGTRVPWVKLDLEVHSRLVELPELPFDYIEFIGEQRTEEQEKLLTDLYGKYFLVTK